MNVITYRTHHCFWKLGILFMGMRPAVWEGGKEGRREGGKEGRREGGK